MFSLFFFLCHSYHSSNKKLCPKPKPPLNSLFIFSQSYPNTLIILNYRNKLFFIFYTVQSKTSNIFLHQNEPKCSIFIGFLHSKIDFLQSDFRKQSHISYTLFQFSEFFLSVNFLCGVVFYKIVQKIWTFSKG